MNSLNGALAALGNLCGLDRIDPSQAADFSAFSYRTAAARLHRITLAVLLVDLPLFLLVDARNYAAGSWADQPAHERIFWWRVGLTLLLLAAVGLRAGMADRARADRWFAWLCVVGYPMLGAWFSIACHTLITDVSIYAVFTVCVAAMLPLPGLAKLATYPVSLAVLLVGLRHMDPLLFAGLHNVVNAVCVAIGAVVIDVGALRNHVLGYVNARRAAEQSARADQLLRNVLPDPIVERLKVQPGAIVEFHGDVTILFADFVGFGQLSRQLPAEQLIELLGQLFLAFDEAADRYGVEKIKTIGDAYMAACGVPLATPDHAQRAATLALEILAIARRFEQERGLPVRFRIGLHSGPAIAGVIGRRKFCYDLWGETVNLASRMESSGEAGRVHLTDAVLRRLHGRYAVQPRAPMQLKDGGTLQTYFLAP